MSKLNNEVNDVYWEIIYEYKNAAQVSMAAF